MLRIRGGHTERNVRYVICTRRPLGRFRTVGQLAAGLKRYDGARWSMFATLRDLTSCLDTVTESMQAEGGQPGPSEATHRVFSALDTHGKALAEYIWLGGSGTDLRSQSKVLDRLPTSLGDFPVWHFDGSCSGQAVEENFQVYLRPQAYFRDPFRSGTNYLVLCGTFLLPEDGSGELAPHVTNNRVPCNEVMNNAQSSEPIFSVDQEYSITNPSTSWIISSQVGSVPMQGPPSYCGAGAGVVAGREVAEGHMRACLHAGLKVSGTSATSTPGQWSYRLGPCVGVELADELWVSRYILLRTAEMVNLHVSFDPEPVPGNLRTLTCHVEFSTAETRTPVSGMQSIEVQIERLRAGHVKHVIAYGKGYLQRLAAPSQDLIRQRSREFTCGYGSKLASIMIPHSTRLHQQGVYVDQRPASNMDPYLVTALLVSTALGIPLPPVPAHMQGAADSSGDGGQGQNREGGVTDGDDGLEGGGTELDGGNLAAWEGAFMHELIMHEAMIPDTPPLHRIFNQPMNSHQMHPQHPH